MCQITSINTSCIDLGDEEIPELGISMWCVLVSTNFDALGRFSVVNGYKTLTIGRDQMDILSDRFKCEPRHIAANLAGMTITEPRFGNKLVINKDYAEDWQPRAFYCQEGNLPVPERKVYKNNICNAE